MSVGSCICARMYERNPMVTATINVSQQAGTSSRVAPSRTAELLCPVVG